MSLRRRAFVLRSSALASGFALTPGVRAAPNHGTLPRLGYPLTANFGYPNSNSIVVAWNRALTSAIAARAIAMTHEAIYNAWATWDRYAEFTLSAMRSRPSAEKTPTLQAIAISHAAHIVLSNLFPSQRAVFDSLLAYAAPIPSGGGITEYKARSARDAGVLAGDSLLQTRRNDGSNQYGDLAPGAYADTSGYRPINTPDTIVDISSWQPLRLADASGVTVVQSFLTPHWGQVRPFALTSGSVYRPSLTHRVPTQAEMNELISLSAALDNTTKALVDLWAANPGSVSPPGQWMEIAEQVSAADGNSLDRDVKLFFAAGQAVLDASIAAWDTKRAYDTVRPISAIRHLFRDQVISAWGGPNQGTRQILGQQWHPYQRTTSPTPPFPEIVSGHSTFSGAAAKVIAGLRSGGDNVTITGTIPAGGIGFETNMPSQQVTFTWRAGARRQGRHRGTEQGTRPDRQLLTRRVGLEARERPGRLRRRVGRRRRRA